MEDNSFYLENIPSFRKIAPFYNLIAAPLHTVRRKVAALSGVEKRDTVLDIYTGTGAQAFAFGKKGFDVLGVDISPDMLDIAVKNNIYRNVRFEIADATGLPFGDKSFDVAVISLALHDMPHEIRPRVL
jgi:ubiquinone/menaquinone biosynthesis C-methylase UbiE